MPYRTRMPAEERLAMVLDAIEYGAATLREVGGVTGVTGEYARQLLNRLGPPVREMWLARMVENRNRGTITAFGVRKTYAQWVRDPRCGAGVLTTTLGSRVESGWDPVEAVTTPRLECGDVRPSLRRPDVVPAEDAERLAELCRAATRVRGWTAADDPGRAAALERDELTRELNDRGYPAWMIAEAVGYSVFSVEMWLRYTAGSRKRYERIRVK